MFSKKLISIVMVVVLLLTMAVVPTAFNAKSVDAADTSAVTTSDYGLTGNSKTGNILQAFNWSMDDLVKYAPEIAAAGYSTVQISPIQKTKVTANDGSYSTDWWSFYQPLDFTIGNALGTEAELKEAVNALHANGVKVIADVVTNHVQQCQDKATWNQLSATIKSFCRRTGTATVSATDNTRDSQTTGDLGGLKDINTENKDYQNYVINNLLIPLLNDGIDGFRFDAAKHIATPSDGGSYDYWPTVINAIKNKKSDAYIYGEVLSLAGKSNISGYTQYMSVTDFAYGNVVRGALNSKNASSLVNYGYSGTSKDQNVLWVESHDNFCNNETVSLSKKQQILGWAAIGARADAPALFFVRPKHEALDSAGFIKYDELMGAPGSSETWKDPTVVAVNRFKNAFAGQNENVSANGSNLFVQRGTTGMVIVNLNGSSTSINQNCSMANGTYIDQVSGATFTVSGGKISGNVGSTGVAVVYNLTASNSAPTITLKLDGTELTPETLSRYTNATANIVVSLKNATSGTIKLNNLDAVTVNGGDTSFTLNSGISYGKSVDVTITATNGSKTVTRTYNIKKKNPNETKKVYFDNSKMKWPEVCVFCKTGVAPSTKIADYNAYKLTGTQTGILSYTVPANTNYVKFNEGYIGPSYTDKAHTDEYGRCHLFHSYNECNGFCGRTMPETVVNYGTANNAANRENGGYLLVGAMIMRGLRFEDYGDYPAATLTAADTSLKGTGSDPTQAPTEAPTDAPTQVPTQAPTDAPTQAPTEPAKKLYLGDADLDGIVTVIDVTRIQRKCSGMVTLNEDATLCADVDKSKSVSILDATAIQRYLASIENPYSVGNEITAGGEDPTEAPQPTTQPTEYQEDPTTAPITGGPLPFAFVAVIYCEAAGTDDTSRNKEASFDTATGTLNYDFVGDSYVFVRKVEGGIQYATDGWTNFANPVTLVNEHNLSSMANFNKMYVPAGNQTLYLAYHSDTDTCTLQYGSGGGPIIVEPTTPVVEPTSGPVIGDNDINFIPGAASVDDPAWFAWVWNNGSEGTWIAGVAEGDNIVYPGAAVYDNMLVARMPSGSTQGDWSKCWNQSEDIVIQSGKTLAFDSWGGGNKFKIKWI